MAPSTMLLYDLRPHANIIGSFFLLSANNIAAVNRTWGLLQTNNSVAAYGEEFKYDEFLVASSAAVARVSTVVSLALALLLIYIPPVS
jgi:predicted transcriptional regulator